MKTILKCSLLFAIVATLTMLSPENSAAHNTRVKCRTPCSACTHNITGTWRYTLLLANIPKVGFPKEVTLTRSGNSFTGVNDSHTFVGSLRGKWLNFTMVVTGEETEGHVRKIDGTVDSDRITGVYLDSNGEIGSFVANKIA